MPWTRRRLLRTLFCSSALAGLNLSRNPLSAAEPAAGAADDLHWLAIGDFGSESPSQLAVARGMAAYVRQRSLRPEGLLFLGDNFYGPMPGGVRSPRWKSGFEEMYPADIFPGPCPAVLGNHDYHDNPDGAAVQLAYASHAPGTRWTMPSPWYRRDWPASKPLVTFFFLDTNTPKISGGPGGIRDSLSHRQEAAQWEWLESELRKPRAPWTVVLGHHPVYSNGRHGDTPQLVKRLGPLLQKSRAAVYLCGHDHDLQHLELEGLCTSYVISGGGGARVREGSISEKERGPFSKAVYGFTHIHANPREMIFRHLDANGRLLHGFRKLPSLEFAV